MEEKFATDTIRYLYSIDEYLKGSTGVENQLRQGLLQKARIIELRKDIALPKKTTKPRVKCPKCCMPRKDGLAEYRLQKNKIGRFYKNLKRKMEKGEALTKYQYKYLKKKKNTCEQVLEIRCKLCKHKVAEDVKKPDFTRRERLTRNEQKISSKKVEIRKEKKNKKGKLNKNKKGNPIAIGKNILNGATKPKKTKNKKSEKVSELPSNNNTQSFKNSLKRMNKMNAVLLSTCKIKNKSLNDFIKSVT